MEGRGRGCEEVHPMKTPLQIIREHGDTIRLLNRENQSLRRDKANMVRFLARISVTIQDGEIKRARGLLGLDAGDMLEPTVTIDTDERIREALIRRAIATPLYGVTREPQVLLLGCDLCGSTWDKERGPDPEGAHTSGCPLRKRA